MFRSPQKAVYTLSLYFGLLIGVRFGSEWFIRNFVVSLGFGEDEVLRFVYDNEMSLQAFCLVVALASSAWLLRLEWFNLSRSLLESKKFLVLTPVSEICQIFCESLFRGFLVAAGVVGLSVFLGYSILEVPSYREVAWFQLLPSLVVQAFLLLIWFSLLDLQRYFLFKIWIEKSETQAEALVSRLVVVGFESLFYFWILNNSFFWLERFYLALLCLLMAAGQLLWFESTYLRRTGRKLSIKSVRRVSVIFAFSFSLIHVFGQSVGGFKRVSWMSSFPGPLREPTGNLALSSPAGQVLFALLLVLSINLLIRKHFKENSGLNS